MLITQRIQTEIEMGVGTELGLSLNWEQIRTTCGSGQDK